MNKPTFKPTTEITFTTVEQNRRRLVEFCRELNDSEFILNIKNVEQCDSAGLAFLIEAKRIAYQFQKKCCIEGMSKAVLALAEFCGVKTLLAL